MISSLNGRNGREEGIPVKGRKIFLEGHGCSASLADTEIIGGIISSAGCEIVQSEDEAEIGVIVTCYVKTVTEQRMLCRIKELSKRYDGKVVVAGCLPKAVPSKVLSIDPRLSLIGPNNVEEILPSIEAVSTGRQIVSLESKRIPKLGFPRTRKNDIIGIVEIASGCLSSCTFCQVKLVKGVIFSYPEPGIISEAETLIQSGVKEIWLTSTDNSCYGRETGSSLANLIKRITSLPGDFKIRIGMMNPLLTGRMLEDLIEAFKHDKVFKFLHLPVQSGSNRILKLMQRGYTIDDFMLIVEKFRQEIKDLTLSTDMIVGFPTETDDDFDDSMRLLKEANPDVVNISRFGAREGTKAAAMEGQVNSQVAKRRSTTMTLLVKEISSHRNRMWVGWRGDILIDEISEDAFIGRNFAYKPCVLKSGFDHFSPEERKSMLGHNVNVKVESYSPSALLVSPD